jgi:hypothetical protein
MCHVCRWVLPGFTAPRLSHCSAIRQSSGDIQTRQTPVFCTACMCTGHWMSLLATRA